MSQASIAKALISGKSGGFVVAIGQFKHRTGFW